jgi:hypothetical protein
MVVIQSVELMVLFDLSKDVANILLSGPIVTTLLVFAYTTFYDDIKVFLIHQGIMSSFPFEKG